MQENNVGIILFVALNESATFADDIVRWYDRFFLLSSLNYVIWDLYKNI
jgi:hypothetical protein